MKSQKIKLVNSNKRGWDGMGHVEDKEVIVYATEEARKEQIRQFLEYWQGLLTAHCKTENMKEAMKGNIWVECGPLHEA